MYTEISIVAPDSAQAGQTVSVEVAVKNLVDYTIYVIPVIDVNGGRSEGSYETIVPGQTLSWYFQFTMPSEGVTVTAESWCESYYFEWQLDATAQKAITVLAVPDIWSMIGPLLVLGLMAGMVLPMMKGAFK